MYTTHTKNNIKTLLSRYVIMKYTITSCMVSMTKMFMQVEITSYIINVMSECIHNL